MNKLAEIVANGEIDVEELNRASEFIERAQFVKDAIEACKKTIVFPLGTEGIKCYFNEKRGSKKVWGYCTVAGIFKLSGHFKFPGEYDINILSFKEVFLALDTEDISEDLRSFLEQQIEKEKTQEAEVK